MFSEWLLSDWGEGGGSGGSGDDGTGCVILMWMLIGVIVVAAIFGGK